MPIDSNTLLNEVRCLSCGSMSESEMIIAGLLQRIAEAGGGGGGGGSPGAPLNSVQFNDAGAFGGSAELTFNDTTNVLQLIGSQNILQVVSNVAALTIAGHALTAANAQSMISGAGTWNTTANPVALRLAITDTASGATSKLLELLAGAAGATSMFSVSRIGVVTAPFIQATSTVGTDYPVVAQLHKTSGAGNVGLNLSDSSSVGWTGADGIAATNTMISRQAAGILEVNNGTPGTYRDLWVRHLRLATAFTVATLPVAGVQGRMAYVTDALTPTFLTLAVGGGAVVTPVFDNGTNWVTV